MKRSCEYGPRCKCGTIGEVVAPGRAKCNSERHTERWSGPREFPFLIESREFYVTGDDLTLVKTEPLSGGDVA